MPELELSQSMLVLYDDEAFSSSVKKTKLFQCISFNTFVFSFNNKTKQQNNQTFFKQAALFLFDA